MRALLLAAAARAVLASLALAGLALLSALTLPRATWMAVAAAWGATELAAGLLARRGTERRPA